MLTFKKHKIIVSMNNVNKVNHTFRCMGVTSAVTVSCGNDCKLTSCRNILCVSGDSSGLWTGSCLRFCSTRLSRASSRVSRSRLAPVCFPTFPPVRARGRVHRVYSDTADSPDTPPDSHAPRVGPMASRPRTDHAPPRV